MRQKQFSQVRIFKGAFGDVNVEFVESETLAPESEIKIRVHEKVTQSSLDRLNILIYHKQPKTDWAHFTKIFSSIHLDFSKAR